MTKSEQLKRRIRSGMALKDYENKDMACKMHLSEPTWYRKMKNPEKLTAGELWKIEKILPIKIFDQNEV